MVQIKEIQPHRCAVGVWEKDPDEGTKDEHGISVAIIHGLKVINEIMADMTVNYGSMDIDDPHSELARRVKEVFKP